MPGTEILIRDFETGVPLPLGAESEITIRSPSVTKAYWQKPEATAEAFIGDWLRPATSARYKVPRVRILGSLPMTATGKVKEELATLLG